MLIDAQDFLNAADLNQDGELNFAEMALTVSDVYYVHSLPIFQGH